ncbi:MAG: M15 family metallopeptidase [Oscillospiraceae bacterium]|nr:M15 family metallopeptidase [Oscillospiraceae bacterium]
MLLKYFPEGVPQTEEEMRKYLSTFEVECLDTDGSIIKREVTAHFMVESSLKSAVSELTRSGKAIYYIRSFKWRRMAAYDTMSMHAYGLAVDINPRDNCCIKNGRILAGEVWEPETNAFSLTARDADIFIKKGWYWGGNWVSLKDYMHFSVTDS